EVDPVRTLDGDGFAILAAAAWRQHQRRRLGQRDGGIVDQFPALVDAGSPVYPRKSSVAAAGPWRGRLEGAGVPTLDVEDQVRAWKQDAAHHLSEVTKR